MAQATNYSLVRELIEDGDVLAFCGRNWISFNTGGPCYHIGIAKWVRNGHDELLIVQARAFQYVSASALTGDVRLYPGAIHVLRPTCPTAVRRQAAGFALDATGADRGYGWPSLVRTGLMHAPLLHMALSPFLRRLLDTSPGAITPENKPKDCAQLIECCYRRAGFPLVSERKHDVFVEPNSLWDSPVLELKYSGLYVPAEMAA